MHTKPHVLVVDDELGIREVLEIVLGNAGYEVALAENPAQAQEALKTTAVDMMITDLFMGKLIAKRG